MAEKKILLVCTGNTCRSPMASALLQAELDDASYRVVSAGVAAPVGHPAAGEAIKAMAALGLDLNDHRAQALTPALVADACLILTMTYRQKEQVLQLTPQAEGKVFTLKEYADRVHITEIKAGLQRLKQAKEERLAAFDQKHGKEERALQAKLKRLQAELEQTEAELNRLQGRKREATAALRLKEKELYHELSQKLDIADPFGGDLDIYKKTGAELKYYIERLVQRLKKEQEEAKRCRKKDKSNE